MEYVNNAGKDMEHEKAKSNAVAKEMHAFDALTAACRGVTDSDGGHTTDANAVAHAAAQFLAARESTRAVFASA